MAGSLPAPTWLKSKVLGPPAPSFGLFLPLLSARAALEARMQAIGLNRAPLAKDGVSEGGCAVKVTSRTRGPPGRNSPCPAARPRQPGRSHSRPGRVAGGPESALARWEPVPKPREQRAWRGSPWATMYLISCVFTIKFMAWTGRGAKDGWPGLGKRNEFQRVGGPALCLRREGNVPAPKSRTGQQQRMGQGRKTECNGRKVLPIRPTAEPLSEEGDLGPQAERAKRTSVLQLEYTLPPWAPRNSAPEGGWRSKPPAVLWLGEDSAFTQYVSGAINMSVLSLVQFGLTSQLRFKEATEGHTKKHRQEAAFQDHLRSRDRKSPVCSLLGAA
ncbi:uncharacterized protein LOC104867086 [Fukomys damarensis]|uniref:uncharacterized protein LOC104867086 n=1 Tax=Fukomys damarensis TaxID=885580 RepID=UPI0008FEF243|nr:uncharacterized protein LOC104867086 [Fukomys damarensis]